MKLLLILFCIPLAGMTQIDSVLLTQEAKKFQKELYTYRMQIYSMFGLIIESIHI